MRKALLMLISSTILLSCVGCGAVATEVVVEDTELISEENETIVGTSLQVCPASGFIYGFSGNHVVENNKDLLVQEVFIIF